jgi:hypothetical protein
MKTIDGSQHHDAIRREPSRSLALALALLGAATLAPLAADANPGNGKPFQQLQAEIDALEDQLADAGEVIEGQQEEIDALEVLLEDLAAQVAALADNHLTCATQVGDDVRFEGCNVHVLDGSGDTDGATNGVGNLFIGYNELVYADAADRTGSHNLVIGEGHSFTSYGGIVAGRRNHVLAENASVLGGQANRATGARSVVVAGQSNVSGGLNAAILGGGVNEATGHDSTISGGGANYASGFSASIAGGEQNEATFSSSSVAGGLGNVSSSYGSSVSGGADNVASGVASTVSGGVDNVAGTASYTTVSGGEGNVADAPGEHQP